MPFSRIGSLLLSGLLLSGCSAAETAPPPVAAQPVAEPPPADAAPEPTPVPTEPQPSLRERWRSPFGVVSRGRAAARDPRNVVVLAQSSSPPAATAPAESGEAKPAGAAPSAPATAEPKPAVPERSTRGAETRGARTHKVEWGETWYGIARRYQVSPAALGAANPDLDPEKLRSGQVLRIPSGLAAAPGQRTHRVGSGDSLWGIARRYGVTMEQLRKANGLKEDRIKLGQTLIIPRTEESR